MTPNTLSVLRVAPDRRARFLRRRRGARRAGGRAHRLSRLAGALQRRSEHRRDDVRLERHADDDRRRAAGEVRLPGVARGLAAGRADPAGQARRGPALSGHRPAAATASRRERANARWRRSRASWRRRYPENKDVTRGRRRSSPSRFRRRIRTTFYAMLDRRARRDADRLRERHQPAARPRGRARQGVRHPDARSGPADGGSCASRSSKAWCLPSSAPRSGWRWRSSA